MDTLKSLGLAAVNPGTYAGAVAWKAYMRRQTVALNWGASLPLAQGVRFDVT